MRRPRNFLGPQGMGGMVSLWGASSLVDSVQEGTITIGAASLTNTATISAVDTSRSILVQRGATGSYSGSVTYEGQAWLAFTNGTTVTATRYNNSGYTVAVSYAVIQFAPGVIKSVQRGTYQTAASGTTATATITAVNTSKSFVMDLGQYSTSYRYISDYLGYQNLTNATTVTGTRGMGGSVELIMFWAYQVVEFF